jgi:hypothetical protein
MKLLLIEQLYGSRGYVFSSFKVEHRVIVIKLYRFDLLIRNLYNSL